MLNFLFLQSILGSQMACFGCYNEYFANFEKAKHIEQSLAKANRSYRDFTEVSKSKNFFLPLL